MSHTGAFAKGFVWGAVIGWVARRFSFRTWAIIGAVVCAAGYFATMSQAEGIEDAHTAGATVEIMGFDTSDPYAKKVVAHVINPSDRALDSFSAECDNIDFNVDQRIEPGHEATVTVDFANVGVHRTIDPFTANGPIPCQFTDSDFE